MRHKISIRFSARSPRNLAIARQIRACIAAALQAERMPHPCEINVLVTDDAGIRQINQTMRQIDKPTDVLSFPMFSFVPGSLPDDLDEDQAQAYGHSAKREIGYLTIHSVLHLLGYDHLDEGPQKRQMRAREEQILADIVLPRK